MIVQEQLPMVAVPSMNDTHLEEMIIVNRLESAARSGDIQSVEKILQEFHEHSIEHFTSEETLMKESGFPAFHVHKAEHDRHLHELEALRKYFDTNRDTKAIVAYLDGNLVKWIIHHIQTMDTVSAMHIQTHLNS
ncbi:MAG: hemerythrin family protein [Campylobacterales bacterium]|nr:hemerythrin family protein [Campylobacterales bacterium]